MKTTSFTKKTYEVYDENHMAVYFNEQTVTLPAATASDDEQQPVTALQYDMVLAQCKTADKGAFVDAIIRDRYSLSDELAIQRHYNNAPEAYADEWADYNQWCEQAKSWVTQML